VATRSCSITPDQSPTPLVDDLDIVMGLSPIVSNEQQPASSLDDQQTRTTEKTCYDLMESVLTGTTSHQHYRPPHRLPGHDLVIDLNGQANTQCSPPAGSGNRMPQRNAAAVPLGEMSGADDGNRTRILSLGS
jgi:hypothetical protein